MIIDNKSIRKIVVIAGLLLCNSICNADKIYILIKTISNSDIIIVNNEEKREGDIITENQIWQWGLQNNVIVTVTPLNGIKKAQNITISKSDMENCGATSLEFLNLVGKGINNMPDAFVIKENQQVLLPIKAYSDRSYYTRMENFKIPLQISDTSIIIPSSIFSEKDTIYELDIFCSRYDEINDNVENQKIGVYSFIIK